MLTAVFSSSPALKKLTESIPPLLIFEKAPNEQATVSSFCSFFVLSKTKCQTGELDLAEWIPVGTAGTTTTVITHAWRASSDGLHLPPSVPRVCDRWGSPHWIVPQSRNNSRRQTLMQLTEKIFIFFHPAKKKKSEKEKFGAGRVPLLKHKRLIFMMNWYGGVPQTLKNVWLLQGSIEKVSKKSKMFAIRHYNKRNVILAYSTSVVKLRHEKLFKDILPIFSSLFPKLDSSRAALYD